MKPLDLDRAGYGGTYKLIGGRLALDLINTVSWPQRSREHDWLSSPTNLDRWCDAARLPAGPAAMAGDLEAVHQLRREVSDAVTPLAFGEHPAQEAITQLNVRLVATLARRFIHPQDLDWTWSTPSSSIERFAPVLLDAADIVTATSQQRLRHCDGCDWLFEDQSRNGKRRWCDMADCGSRAKSRDYYHRRKP